MSTSHKQDEARTTVSAALQADPNIPQAHELLGGILAEARQLPEAAHEYTEAVRLNPQFARAHLDLARVLAAQDDISALLSICGRLQPGPIRE